MEVTHERVAFGAYLVTPGFKLPNLWVIHVRAASYTNHDDAIQILEQAIEAALKAAHQNDIRALAMPAIGTGVFAFSPELAAEITAKVFCAASALAPHLQCIRVCVASDFLREVYVAALQAQGLHVAQEASAPV